MKLIAHYKMNDNLATAVVVDETGNHNGEYQLNSVAQNTSTGASTGKINGALDFVGGTGSGEHIEIADHVDFSPGNAVAGSGTPFSISIWAISFIILLLPHRMCGSVLLARHLYRKQEHLLLSFR